MQLDDSCFIEGRPWPFYRFCASWYIHRGVLHAPVETLVIMETSARVFRRSDRYRDKIYRNFRLTDVSQVFMKTLLFATCSTIEQNIFALPPTFYICITGIYSLLVNYNAIAHTRIKYQSSMYLKVCRLLVTDRKVSESNIV